VAARPVEYLELFFHKNMPRESYPLSEATKDVLTDNVKAMSSGWDKSKTHIYNILDETTQDPFPEFRSMYRGAAKAGLSRQPWRDELDIIDARYSGNQSVADAALCFKDKLRSHNQTLERYMEFLEDGEIDADEMAELERLLQREQDDIDLIRNALKLKRSHIGELKLA
jgi:hypothetical protein